MPGLSLRCGFGSCWLHITFVPDAMLSIAHTLSFTGHKDPMRRASVPPVFGTQEKSRNCRIQMAAPQHLCSQPLNYEYPRRTIGDTSRESPTESQSRLNVKSYQVQALQSQRLPVQMWRRQTEPSFPSPPPDLTFPQAAPGSRV